MVIEHGLIERILIGKTVGTLFIGNVLAMGILFFIAFVPDRLTVLLALGILPYIAWAMPPNFAF